MTALVPAQVARGTRGAVASPHHLASEAGLGVLRAGGNAVDAAIATNAALAVVSSYMCGLGGDAFWLIWDGERQYGLNGSGRSAAGASLEAARGAGLERIPLRGPWSVTVPGGVRSWGDAHARLGRVEWASLFAPAIELADDGFAATAGWQRAVEGGAVAYGEDGDWAQTFRPAGEPWRIGARVRLPALARTLGRLAEEGPGALYEGAVGRRSAAYLEQQGSPIRHTDLADHRSDWAEPVSTRYRGVTATSHPANSCGPIALELLNILGEMAPPAPDAFTAAGVTDADWLHACLEAGRLTLLDRDSAITDPEATASASLERLLSRERARELRARIDPHAMTPPKPHVLPGPARGGTIYLATADRRGGAVSLIESNYAGFGSGLVDPETGIGFQNRGAFFRLEPGHPNALAPRKRTMHTLTPGMLFRDGRPWVVHGSMGGEIQPQVFAQVVSALVDGGLDLAGALAAPRWAADVEEHYGPPVLSTLESRYPPAIFEELERRGHRIHRAGAFDSGLGHAHAIELLWEADGNLSSLAAATDPRSEGLPATL